VALLEALEADRDWTSVTLEPDHVSKKIDILWQYPGKTKAVQVKSSINPFEDAEVKQWARDLEESRAADEYELILVGTPSKPAVAKARRLGKVAVPAPRNLDLTAFTRQSAQLLDCFMVANSLVAGNPYHREMLARALAGELMTLATRARPFTRDELIDLLKLWITQAPKDIPAFPIFECPPRNPWFTGRDKEIGDLRERLCQTGKAAIGQAISGLGGIGKTQVAIEYAHRHRDDYDAVFWINGASDLDLQTGYGKVAKLLRLPHDAKDPDNVLAAVKRWLEGVDDHCWLLVLDNADDPPVLKPYLPSRAPNGHILVTSRNARLDVLRIRSPLSIKRLPIQDSTRFLLDRVDRAPANELEAAGDLARELDGLPLAPEQAAAYVTAMRVTYEEYLASYRTRRLGLLERIGPVTGDYPMTVATTWLMNFEQVEAVSKAAADLLRLSAMFVPNDIPIELLTKGAQELGHHLREAINVSDPLSANEVLEPLTRFSLVAIDAEGQTFSIHRLVQEVVKRAMGTDGQRLWAGRAIKAITYAFHSVATANRSAYERLSDPSPGERRAASMRTVVIGIGNPLVTDNSVGLRVADELKGRLAGLADVTADPGARKTLELMERMVGFDRAVVIRSMYMGQPPGTVRHFTCDNRTTRDWVSLPTALALCRHAGLHLPAEDQILTIGIEPEDEDTFGEKCTPAVEAAIPGAVQDVLEALGQLQGDIKGGKN
jgi:hydrogenase maturation protease